MTKEKIKVGLIGAGIISWAHEAGYDEVPDKAQIVSVSDVDKEKANNRAKAHQAKVTKDYREILADQEVDLVDITLPHHLHHGITIATLEAKKTFYSRNRWR
jgi:predicted dehydrogenase